MIGQIVAETRIGSSEFGDYHYIQFLLWAFGDRKSKASLLKDIAVARTDANQELIDRKIDYYAELYGLETDDLIARIREADENRNMSIPKLHQLLAREAGIDGGATDEPT